MILVKHRWKQNKTEVSGSLVLGFDDKGIARVPDIGNNRTAVETYCRFSKGLAKIVTAAGMLDVTGIPEEEVVEKLKKVSTEIPATGKVPKVSAEEVAESKGVFEPIKEKKVGSEDVTKKVVTSVPEEAETEVPTKKKTSKKKKSVGKKSKTR
jgi:hypothetical protein